MAPPRSPADDSDEEDATAFDARERSVAPRSKAGATPSAVGRSSSRTGQPARSSSSSSSSRSGTAAPEAPLHGDEDDDDERTEFLSRPASRPAQSSLPSDSSASLRARGRAVPITPSSPLPPPGEQAQLRARERTEPIAAVVESPLPQRTPRPLPGRASPLADEPSTTGTVPKITKIRLEGGPKDGVTARVAAVDPTASATDPGGGQAARATARPGRAPTAMIRPADLGRALDEGAADDADKVDSPKEHALREAESQGVDEEPGGDVKPAERSEATAKAPRSERSGTRTRSATAVRKTDTTTSESNGDVQGDGTLVIEAPTDALVFVNGVERGRGVVKVPGMDRFAKHAVRIHASGFAPWSGSVCLEGKLAAKVRPSLKPRAR